MAKSSSSSISTRDHDEIRHWAETRHAVPCEVSDTERGNETGILRFKFPDAPHGNDGKLQEISWDEFFEKFDDSNLELIYQEKRSAGERSNFNKLVHPENEEHSQHKSGSKRSGSRKQAA